MLADCGNCLAIYGRHTPSIVELRDLPLCKSCERLLGNDSARLERVKQSLKTGPVAQPAEVRTNALECLTPRQRELVSYVRLGLSNSEIATEMGIGRQVVKNMIYTICDRLGVENRVKVAVFGATWVC